MFHFIISFESIQVPMKFTANLKLTSYIVKQVCFILYLPIYKAYSLHREMNFE